MVAPTTNKVQDYVDAAGVRTYYEVEGAGEPLLLLHGGLTTIETFGGLTPLLAQHYRVFLPERRAHGRSPDVEGPMTYEVMADDTIAFMAAVGLPSAHVVGWSDGAVVGLLVALQRPDLVRKLVLIGQNVNPDGLPPEMIEMMKLDKMPDMLPPRLREMYAAVSPDGPEHWDVVVDKAWQMIRSEPNIALSELAKVSAPTLVMVADRDFPTVEHAAAMQRSLPDSQLAVVPGATHGMPMEKPDVVARLVLDFLGAPAKDQIETT
jgi:pimeloyl-ACP methyl ester carboxylesterase